MQKNSTDDIALRAWNATRTHIPQFILFPILVTLVFGGLMGVNVSFGSQSTSALYPLISLGLGLGYFVFAISFWTALAKWSSELHSGAKQIHIGDGLRYGVSRFWGVLGTSLLTLIKVFFWSILLILPGVYKGMQYMHSTQVSQLDQISGGDANKLSKAVVMNAGILRAFSNLMGVYNLVYILSFFILFIPFMFIGAGVQASLITVNTFSPELLLNPEIGALTLLGLVLGTLAALAVFPLSITFFMVFINFHYIMLRDEQKIAFQAAKKAL